MYVAEKLAKHSGWKRGYNTMIRSTFCLFAEENFLSNYRCNIGVSSHALPHDWRKHKNRTAWAQDLNSQHDLIGKAPHRWIRSFFIQRTYPALLSLYVLCTFTLCWKTSQLSLEWATKNAEHLQCFQKGTYRAMCGTVRLAELTPYKTTDMQTWLSFSQAIRALDQRQSPQNSAGLQRKGLS